MIHRVAVVAWCLLAACWSSTGTSSELSNSVPTSGSGSGSSSATGDVVAGDADTTGSGAAGLRVSGVEPALGDELGGTFVVIKGERFMKDGPRNAKVYFGVRQGTVVRFQSDGELIVQAPGGKANERVDVTVVFDPGGPMTLSKAFTFVANQPAPTP